MEAYMRQTFRSRVPVWLWVLLSAGIAIVLLHIVELRDLVISLRSQPLDDQMHAAVTRKWYMPFIPPTLNMVVMLYLTVRFWLLQHNSKVVTDAQELVVVDYLGRALHIPWEKVGGIRVSRIPGDSRVSVCGIDGRKSTTEMIVNRDQLVDAIVSKAGLVQSPASIFRTMYRKP